jgi:hypothetical protein
MSGSGIVTFLVLTLLGFIGFVIYFIFKILQFVLVSANLYKKMVRRQDATIKLLIDIRDNTKQFDKSATVDDKDDKFEEPQDEPEKCVCGKCDAEVLLEDKVCPKCGTDLGVSESADCICGECGAEVSDTDKFCPKCGVEISELENYACSACGADVSVEDTVCSGCGKKLTDVEETKQTDTIIDDPNAAAYCPKCKSTYRKGFAVCLDCGVDLVRHAKHQEPS